MVKPLGSELEGLMGRAVSRARDLLRSASERSDYDGLVRDSQVEATGPLRGVDYQPRPGTVFVCGVSRSGTTLLATILDSHPDIAMGYELLPLPGLPDLARIRAAILDEKGAVLGLGAAVELLPRVDSTYPLRKFLAQCDISGVTAAELLTILERTSPATDDLKAMAKLAMAVAEFKRVRDAACFRGFKLNTARFAELEPVYPESHFVLIVRDPRAVVASQKKAEFKRPIEKACGHWLSTLRAFEALQAQIGRRAMMIGYEQLVTHPDSVLASLFSGLGLRYAASARLHQKSKASIHKSDFDRSNVDQPLFSDSVSRWKSELTKKQVETVLSLCGEKMEQLGELIAPRTLERADADRDVRRDLTAVYKRIVAATTANSVELPNDADFAAVLTGAGVASLPGNTGSPTAGWIPKPQARRLLMSDDSNPQLLLQYVNKGLGDGSEWEHSRTQHGIRSTLCEIAIVAFERTGDTRFLTVVESAVGRILKSHKTDKVGGGTSGETTTIAHLADGLAATGHLGFVLCRLLEARQQTGGRGAADDSDLISAVENALLQFERDYQENGDGVGYYVSRRNGETEPLHCQTSVGRAFVQLHRVTANAAHRDRAVSLARFYRRCLIKEEPGDTWSWGYNPSIDDRLRGLPTPSWTGTLDVSFAIGACESGIEFVDSDIERFLRTFLNNICLGGGEFNAYVSASKERKVRSAVVPNPSCLYGLLSWMQLASVSRTVRDVLDEAVAKRADIFPAGWLGSHRASLAYAQRL